jgi:type VII secretion integral membrane protein eccD
MLITCHILGAPPLRLTVACATALTVIACTSAAFALTSTPSSIAATTCVIATVLVSLSPWLSLRFAGLRVPQLPSAGQDFNVADIPIDNPEARASRATALLDGILIGTVACAIPAMIVLSLRGDGYTAALCAASAGAVLAHAMRHRSILALWSLWSWGMTSIAAIGLCLLFAGKNTPLLCIGALGALICTTAPLWAHHIKTLSPTTLNWLERFESLAVAATIPLAAHLLGIFSLIRGLG